MRYNQYYQLELCKQKSFAALLRHLHSSVVSTANIIWDPGECDQNPSSRSAAALLCSLALHLVCWHTLCRDLLTTVS